MIKKKKLKQFPQIVNIETTNVCNLTCPMCARTTSMTRKSEHMTFDLYKKIVNEMAVYGVKAVWLHMFGEPLLHPQIVEFVAYIKQFSNINNVGLSSNVTFLNEKISKGVITAGLDKIILSVDAKTHESYKVARGGNFDEVVNNVKRFLTLKKELGAKVEIMISMIDMSFNHEEIKGFESAWSGYLNQGDSILIKPFINFANMVPDFSTTKGGSEADEYGYAPCRKLWNSMTVMSNGKAVACCYDVNGVLEVGNVKDHTMSEIWNGDQLTALRAKHLELNFESIAICKNCSSVKVRKSSMQADESIDKINIEKYPE